MSPTVCSMSTRLMLNNKETRLIVASTSNLMAHELMGYAEIFLPKGDHVVRINYRTDCNYNTINTGESSSVSVGTGYL